MREIPLDAVANQALTVVLDGHTYDIVLHEVGGLMAIDLDRDGRRIVSGHRCLPNNPLLPYVYQFSGAGNFVFVTQNDSYPYFTDFGVTCFLHYLAWDEINAGA